MPGYSAIIWDMDGVLLDSERYWSDEDFFFLKQAVSDWNQVDESLFVGRGVDDMYQILTNRYGMKMDYNEYRHNYNLVAERVYYQKATLMPYAREVLSTLKDKGIRQALVSSSPREWIRMAMDRFQLAGYFNWIISADDTGGQGKPHPAIYHYATKQIQAPLETILVVEDSPAGVEAAKAASLAVVGYLPPHTAGELPEANLMIDDLRHVPEIIDQGISDN